MDAPRFQSAFQIPQVDDIIRIDCHRCIPGMVDRQIHRRTQRPGDAVLIQAGLQQDIACFSIPHNHPASCIPGDDPLAIRGESRRDTGAAEMGNAVKMLQKQELIKVSDAATVIRKPDGKVKVKQANNLVGAGALGGAFWGMLIGLLFLAPWLGMAFGALGGAIGGKFADVGVDDRALVAVERLVERVVGVAMGAAVAQLRRPGGQRAAAQLL